MRIIEKNKIIPEQVSNSDLFELFWAFGLTQKDIERAKKDEWNEERNYLRLGSYNTFKGVVSIAAEQGILRAHVRADGSSTGFIDKRLEYNTLTNQYRMQ